MCWLIDADGPEGHVKEKDVGKLKMGREWIPWGEGSKYKNLKPNLQAVHVMYTGRNDDH